VLKLPVHLATRYVVPLREGGSLPAVVETGSGELFVVKFRGAGQGPRALLAELIVGMLASEAGLPVPGLALVEVDPALGRGERDPEIQDLLRASHGVNVGLRYLEGAFNFDPSAASDLVDPHLAADLVWFDALVTNPDRTARNPNLLIHQRRPWLIDHGAALFVHHSWDRLDEARTRSPFEAIRDHVLLSRSGDLAAADRRMAERLGADVVDRVLEALPTDLLLDPLARGTFDSAEAHRDRYRAYLMARLAPPRPFLAAAREARERVRTEVPGRLESRR
jgi:hypothetical protein